MSDGIPWEISDDVLVRVLGVLEKRGMGIGVCRYHSGEDDR